MDGSVGILGDLEDELLSKMVKPSTAQNGRKLVPFKTSYRPQ